jgi:hypothetical protein
VPLPSDDDTPLDAATLVGSVVVDAGWLDELRDFQVELQDGRALVFEECLQASLLRPITFTEPLAITGVWDDEPSPVLASLGPEVRFNYQHLVFELGDGLLRVVCRELILVDLSDDDSPNLDGLAN